MASGDPRRSASLSWLLLLGTTSAQNKALPTPHRQFSVSIETTAHQLNATSDYPPYKRYMTVYYDYTARRARIDYAPVPHMPPKSFVRRYDIGFEWMVMEVRQAKECQKSRMREAMPYARYPDKLIFVGQTRVRGKLCNHWREDLGEETVEYFEEASTGIPLRLTTEAVEHSEDGGLRDETTPLMTYDFTRFEAGAQDESLFRMASSSSSAIFSTDSTLTIDQCERVVQDMGFPYIHFCACAIPAPRRSPNGLNSRSLCCCAPSHGKLLSHAARFLLRQFIHGTTPEVCRLASSRADVLANLAFRTVPDTLAS